MNIQVEKYLDRDPKEIMAKHGKSFYWASRFFNKKMLIDVATLYTFCRYVDDLADECAPDESKDRLENLMKHLGDNKYYFSHLFSKRRIAPIYAKQLLDGALFDVNGGRVDSRKDLLIYCYKVAGVVGLMMSKIIGVKDKVADAYALDLGIGMQLTNICRDVLEDAQNGRLYLPESELIEYSLSMKELSQKGVTPDKLKKIVSDYLLLADTYYESALNGMRYIPLRSRFVILNAARLYQAIGHKIRNQDYNVLQGRVYLNFFEKILITIKVFFEFFFISIRPKNKHLTFLHDPIKGLPGV